MAGETQTWHRADSPGQVMLYTLRQDGWRKGQPVMVNDVAVTIRADNGSDTPLEPVVQTILAALALPGGRVSGGVGEPVAWRYWCESDKPHQGGWWQLVDKHDGEHQIATGGGKRLQPLYALPPAPSIEGDGK